MKRDSKSKIWILSASRFGAIVLEELMRKKFPYSLGLITFPDRPRGRGKKLAPNEAKKVALKFKLPVKEVTSKEEVSCILSQPNYLVALVAGFSLILPESALVAPASRKKNLGLHPSLLPQWRGPAPIQFALLNGDKKTGVSIFELGKEVDAGRIVAQEEVPISPSDTYLTLEEKLARKGAELFAEILEPYLKGEIKPLPQKGKPTYSRLLRKEEGEVNWQKDSPELIWRKFRAFYPWPGVYFILRGKRVKITALKLQNRKLKIEKVIPEGKREMTFAEFLRGYPFPLDLKDKIIYPREVAR
ncbi:methionyl-tRNA formyltransferase [bacterium]|nr:methionyl-tRNA formyltransferase [bacterium]